MEKVAKNGIHKHSLNDESTTTRIEAKQLGRIPRIRDRLNDESTTTRIEAGSDSYTSRTRHPS